MCGKNLARKRYSQPRPGSPPRVREKPAWSSARFGFCGITPACAGKTWSRRSFSCPVKDHPRVCGKNIQKLTKTQGMWGSPPRVREKHPQSNAISTVIRITPACAGKTFSGVGSSGMCKDHPRVCGKNFVLSSCYEAE